MRNILFTAVALCAAPLFAADEAMLRLLPAGTATIAGADVDRVMASRLGQTLFQEFGRVDDDLAKFAAATGFDPRRDIREIVVAGGRLSPRGARRSPPGDLVIVRGTFDETRILGAASVFGGLVNIYQGFRLLTPPREKSVEIAFLGGLAVAGEPASVRAAVDRHVAKAPPGEAAVRAQELAARYHAWAVTDSLNHLGALAPDSNPNAAARNALGSIERAAGGLVFGDQVSVDAEAVTRSAQDATALVDLYRLAVMMQAHTQPPPNSEAEAVRKLVESASATADGNSARFSAAVPSEMIERWFRPGSRRGARPAAGVSSKPVAAR
jgi:hypothetical protein